MKRHYLLLSKLSFCSGKSFSFIFNILDTFINPDRSAFILNRDSYNFGERITIGDKTK